MDDLRIVSATVHNDTNEVEVVVESESNTLFGGDESMFTLWLSAEEVQEKGQEWRKVTKS